MSCPINIALSAFPGLLLTFQKGGILFDYTPERNLALFTLSTLEPLRGKTAGQIFPEPIADRLQSGFQALDNGEKTVEFKLPYRNQLHEHSTIHVLLSALNDSGFEGYLATVTRTENEPGSAEFEQYLLQTLMNHHPDSIYFKDNESRFTRINQACARKFGLADHSEAIGKTDFDFFDIRHAESAYQDEKEIIRTGNPIIAKEEKEYYPDDSGRIKWVTTSKLPLYDENREIIGTFGISRDITEQKIAGEKLRDLNRQLKETNRYKDKLFSVIAHDLRNPVSGLLGMLDIIHQDLDNISREELSNYIDILRQNSRNTYELLEDLLQWARHQSREENVDLTQVHIHGIASEVIRNISIIANEKGVPLENLIPEEFTIEADRNMLNSILRNLVSNAIKFSDTGEKVTLFAARNGEQVEISVIDRGKGIREEDQQKILCKKIPHTTAGTKGEHGSGLGLDLCLDFVEKLNGQLLLESEPGKGSTFRVILPVSQVR